ncbi:hypothetical protein MHL40_15940 [Pseudomonas luteola]|uniref:hypothetical protein n=1 Tax=Pseudomonas luteola TaxID=47886 RepID=UPI0002F39783|nr:hypothetical protein [Pseudomonas luteola]MCG7374149.1 hypothetical protein [Pseudomonas luteola]
MAEDLVASGNYLHAVQRFISGLLRSSLHQLYQRHGISNLQRSAELVYEKKTAKRYPIYLHTEINEGHTAKGRGHRFVVIDRTSKLVYVVLHEQIMSKDAVGSVEATLKMLPYVVPMNSPTMAFNLSKRSILKASGFILSTKYPSARR